MILLILSPKFIGKYGLISYGVGERIVKDTFHS